MLLLPETSGELLIATQEFVRLRSEFVIQQLGESAVIEGLDHDSITAGALKSLDDDEFAQYMETVVSQDVDEDDPSIKVILMQVKFDEIAARIFGDIDGHILGFVEEGELAVNRNSYEIVARYDYATGLATVNKAITEVATVNGAINVLEDIKDEIDVPEAEWIREQVFDLMKHLSDERSASLHVEPTDLKVIEASVARLQRTNARLG